MCWSLASGANIHIWIEKRHNQSKIEDRPYCKYCCDFLSNGKSELKLHASAKCHIEAGLEYNKRRRQEQQLQVYLSKESKVATMELMIASFIAEIKFLLNIVDDLNKLMKVSFPNDDTLKLVNMRKQKLGNVI